MPPKPLGPSEGGGAPAQNMLNWSDMTRGYSGSYTLPQNPNAGPAPQPVQTPQQAPQPEPMPAPQQDPYNNGTNPYAVPSVQPKGTQGYNYQGNQNGPTGAQP
jgi:general secretion pathway protein D